jgi:ATP-dependent DNA ligase
MRFLFGHNAPVRPLAKRDKPTRRHAGMETAAYFLEKAAQCRRLSDAITRATWVKSQLAALVTKAPDGPDWLHEIKLGGYRMHARLDPGRVQILTRRGNDWTGKYPAIAKAVAKLPAKTATSTVNSAECCPMEGRPSI